MGLTKEQAAVFDKQDFPLSEPSKGFEPINAWAQREYVACLTQGASFSAHGDVWIYHYGQPWKWSMDAPNAAAVIARREA